MTTSGTSNFNYTRDQIIRAALRKIGAIAAGETPDAQLVTDSADALNMMVKAWDARGIHLWTESEGILFLQPNQIQYAFGPNSPDHATETNPPNFVQTGMASSAGTGVTTLSLLSATNILVGDNIGVTLDAGNLFWSTVTSVNTSTNVVGIATAMPSSAGATGSNNLVFDYTLPILRPLRVVDARRYVYELETSTPSIETPMFAMSRLDYRDLPNKASTGTPTAYFYDPQMTTGIFYVWPAPPDGTNGIKFTWQRQIMDFNTPANTPDLPQEWLSTLVWGLAVEMAPEFDCPLPRYQMLKQEFMEKMEMVSGWDREPEPIYFGCSMEGNYSGGSGH